MKEDCFSGPRFGYLDGWWSIYQWHEWYKEAGGCVEDERRLDPGKRPEEHLREKIDSEELEVESREMPVIRWQKKKCQVLSCVPLEKQNSQGSRGCQGERCLTVFKYR